ncbi:MAG TPA: hypothetical protein VN086_00725, partial [Candidatus Paceibacterota bacterium]|nr:hypothetical protein [Candidatus Paceibacterota bacterium]
VPPSIGIASGDTVSLVVTIHNGNPAALTDASFNADLPDGTRTGDGSDASFTQYNDVLGPVPAGADVTRTIQVKLFGEAGQVLSIPMKVQYHTAGSNALYQSQYTYTVTISSSPISVQVQTLSQTPSGQSFALTVIVRSNASAPVQDVALTASYPSGFSVQSATPAPSGTNFFSLGTLNPGEQKTVQIRGILVGQDNDQRVFRFDAGSVNSDGTNTLGNTYAEGLANVALTHPFLNVAIALNNDPSEPVIAHPGDAVNALVNWKNTLTTTLANASIHVAFSGNALAPNSVTAGNGFYRSTDSTVIFDNTTNPGLASLPAGSTGVGSFGFSVKPATALTGVQNPTVTMTVSVAGLQSTQGGSAQSVTSTLTRTLKVGTVVDVSSTLAHATGGANGPTPPKAGTETLYSVTLTAKNTINSVGAAKEIFTLPTYVRFTGQADPSITYNPDTHTVTWAIGDLSSGGTATGHFQIGFTPSTSQHNSSPVLVSDQSFTGFDRFTQQQVAATAPALTSELPGQSGSGTVQ